MTFVFLASLLGLWDLGTLIRDRIWALAVKALRPNHWTAREFPIASFLESWLYTLLKAPFHSEEKDNFLGC